ncbi:MAG: class 1 fructose-bisphosphatase [Tabrizicola sp.]|nr:class 1 fructose-bisphosphatase [Tabrizicola sp.]
MTGPAPLVLPCDVTDAPLLDGWFDDMACQPDRAALIDILRRIAHAVPPLSARLAMGRLAGDPARIVGRNSAGDAQKALDVAAHDHFVAALDGASVAAILSEEAPEIVLCDPAGRFAVAMDPIDGSGSIGIGAPLGALFAVFPAEDGGSAFRLPGRRALAAAYASFGHSTDIGLSLGDGVCMATLDPRDGRFRVTDDKLRLPGRTDMVAINASNERHWLAGWQRYAAELRAGREGPRGRDSNMRWLAAAVGELHRILLKGGAFLYPPDRRPGYGEGRIRLIYEAVPIAFLVEAAGGAATDGIEPILDIAPRTLHQNVPLCFGAREEIARIRDHLTRT